MSVEQQQHNKKRYTFMRIKENGELEAEKE